MTLQDLLNITPKCPGAPSDIHGHGLFAMENIASGETIADFSSPQIASEVSYSELTQEALQNDGFIALNEHKCLVPVEPTTLGLLNHADEANAFFDLNERKLKANRKIFSGEEITVNYRLEPYPEHLKKISKIWLDFSI